MKKFGIIIVCCFLSMAAFGQRRERQIVRPTLNRQLSTSDTNYRPVSRAAAAAARTTGRNAVSQKDAAAVPQAPGILQVNLADRERAAWFVVTDTIPQGSSIIAYVAPSGDNYLKLGPYTYNRDLQPGESIALPGIATFGDLWPTGITTYDVVVRVNGTDTHCATDFGVGVARNYNDLGNITPLIYNYSEDLSNRSINLSIFGYFTSDPVKIALDDFVVPASAITQNGGTIVVNLTKIPNFRLDVYGRFLLSVAQAGFSDTTVFTHVPFDPSKYDITTGTDQ